MNTELGNLKKGLYVGIGTVALLYGASLVHLIPASIGNLTIYGMSSWIVAYIGHRFATPAGSTVVTHA